MTFCKEIRINQKIKRTKEEAHKLKDKIAKMRDDDSKMVTGIFESEESESALTFSYRKYKEDPSRTYTFEHGKRYTIPLGVAKHINNDTRVNNRTNILDANGKPTLKSGVSGKRKRFSFTSTEFM